MRIIETIMQQKTNTKNIMKKTALLGLVLVAAMSMPLMAQTVEFEYATALLCDISSTTGNAYVKGKNGTEPYTYSNNSGPAGTA